MFKHKHVWRKTGDCSFEQGTLHYKVQCKKCRESKHITLSEYIDAVSKWAEGSRAWKVIGRATLVYDPQPNPKSVEDYIK